MKLPQKPSRSRKQKRSLRNQAAVQKTELRFERLEPRLAMAGLPTLIDIASGAGASSPQNFTNVNNTVFFNATDPVNGVELWKSDGTAAGTALVKNINPAAGSSFPQLLTNVNGTLFFLATDGTNGIELWKSDGSTAGTVLVKDINPALGKIGRAHV